MSRLLLFIVVLLPAAYAVLTFDNWAVLHEKSYSSPAERQLRAAVWLENDDYIGQHNTGDHSYRLGHNQFSDLSEHDFKLMYSGLDGYTTPDYIADPPPSAIPSAKDWYHACAALPI